MVERRAVENRAAVLTGGGKHLFAQMGIDDDRSRAVQQIQHDRHGKMVRHRQDPNDAILRADAQAPVSGGDAGQQRFVRNNHPFAGARGAGTETDEGRVNRGKGMLVEPEVRCDWHLPDVARRVHDGTHAGFADEALAFGGGEFAGQRHEAFAGVNDG